MGILLIHLSTKFLEVGRLLRVSFSTCNLKVKVLVAQSQGWLPDPLALSFKK